METATDIESLFKQGLNLHRKGNLQSALPLYEQVLAIDPNHLFTLINISGVYQNTGRLDEAYEVLNKALKLEPENPGVLNNLGNLLRARGLLADAKSCSEDGLRIMPESADLHNNLGNVLRDMKHQTKAITHYEQAIALNPKHPDASINAARCWVELGDFLRAETFARAAVALAPNAADILYLLATCLRRQGKKEGAAACYGQILAIDSDQGIAAHWRNVTPGLSPDRAPEVYIRNIFDDYAETFDNHLIKKLKYRIFEHIANLAKETLGTGTKRTILDIGCGTGLCGFMLKDIAERLVGVDPSEKMLQKAAGRNAYHLLEQDDIHHYLENTTERFDLVTAADVLIYLGNPEPVYANVKHVLNPGGTFIFSIEDGSDSTDYCLRDSGRFAHHPEHTQQMLLKAGFTNIRRLPAEIRMESEKKIMGFVFVASV